MAIQSVAIYCGENSAVDEDHVMAAALLGDILAQHNITIVYGGLNQGLMGVVADAALRKGGRVIGVVPENIPEAKRHPGLSEMHVVKDLDARKKMMTELSNACIALPGGHGTMDELEREITLVKLARKNGAEQDRQIVLYNTNGFFNHYLKFVRSMGRIKGSGNDITLFEVVANHEEALVPLGLVSRREYEARYEHRIAYGYEHITQTLPPITEGGKKIEFYRGSAYTALGLGSLIIGGIAFFTPAILPFTPMIPVVLPLCIAIGALSLTRAGDMLYQTVKRPVFNPPDPFGPAPREISTPSKLEALKDKLKARFTTSAPRAVIDAHATVTPQPKKTEPDVRVTSAPA